jgi:hypothetical protein
MGASEQNRPDVAEKRAHWHERLAAEAPARLVFVDESGANTKMTRFRGRAPVGQRLRAYVPHSHYQTTTLVCAVRLSGPSAPCLIEGAMDGEMFLAWIEQGLVAELHQGDLVIMDNLATHKMSGVRRAIEQAGARLEFFAALLARFQSYRKHVEQGQARSAQPGAAHGRRTSCSSQDRLRSHLHCGLSGLLFKRQIRYIIYVNALKFRRLREMLAAASCQGGFLG